MNGQLVTGLQPWMRGDHVVLATPEGYRAKNVIARFWEIVARFRVSMFSGVPTLYAALLETPIGDNDLSSLKFAICGAAPMPSALIRAFEAKTGVKIIEGYGLTEGACVSSLNPPEGERLAGSIGLPIPYQRMAAVILDDEGRFQRMADIGRDRRHRDQRAQRVLGLPRPAPQRMASGSRSTANAGSTPAISVDGTPTATSGSPDARRSSSSAAATTSIRRSSRTRCRRIRRSRWPRRSEARTRTPANCRSPTFS